MKMGKVRGNLWVALVIVIVLISLIVVYTQSKNNMGVYTGGEETTAETEETPKIDLTPHTNEEYGYTIGIPDNWRMVIKDGYETFVHSASATSVQIQVTNYNPSVLNITQKSIETELSAAGYALTDFSWIDNRSYSVIYSKNTEDGMTMYTEITYFDRERIVREVYTIDSAYYDRIGATISAMIDSFIWKGKYPIPDGTRMLYVQEGSFEFAYPADWATGSSNTSYIAQDQTTGAIMSVTATPSTATYEGFSKLDYTAYSAQTRNNFILQSYNSDNNIIYAQATFVYNNTNMVLTQYLIASGTYEYEITFETTQEAYASQSQLFQNIIQVFRIF